MDDHVTRHSGWRKLALCLVVLVIYGLLSACGGGGGNTPPAVWSGTKQLGVPGKDTTASSVATDASGNVYVAGYTDDGLDGNTLTGGSDFFVTKFNRTGVKQ
jgi:hypothetical protein